VSVGGIMGQAWGLYRAHFRHLVSIAFIMYVLIAVLTLVLILLLGNLGALAAVFVGVAAVFWLHGALVLAVDDVRDGRADLTIRQTLEGVRRRINALSLLGFFFVLMFAIAAVLIVVGFFLFFIPGVALVFVFFYFLVRWILAVPVIMLEERGVFGGLDRSGELVRGHFWQVLGVVLLTLLVLIGAGIAISAVLSPLPNGVQGLVAQLVSSTLTAPFVALAWTLMYYELRGAPEPALAAAA
jgi:Membrane domain of glycerophosphoryl diester phosphodiesterase